jgi:hypothetical protein
MDENTSPLDCGSGLDGGLVAAGRASSAARRWRASGLPASAPGIQGLLLEDRGVMRHGQRSDRAGDGVVTSGGFRRRWSGPLPGARCPALAGDRLEVEIRGAFKTARIVSAAHSSGMAGACWRPGLNRSHRFGETQWRTSA